MIKIKKRKGRMTEIRVIALSFVVVILTGAALLTLPVSSASGEFTSFFDCLFTSTSATCVTGLVVYDTYEHWSVFGQCVILLLIQIGGLGFMTLITVLTVFARRHISLQEMRLLTESAGNYRRDGIITLCKRLFLGTIIVEGLGAAVLSFVFIPEMGVTRGMYYSVFHSISAFCNAGFDLFGYREPFSSLTTFNGNAVVNITLAALVIIGGLGFVVWDDLLRSHFKFKKLSLHTKTVLAMTGVLIFAGCGLFLITEYNGALKDMSFPEKLMGAFFQSVTTRTAGFDSINQSSLSDSGILISSLLMLTGGSPGSTAGGIKTTTVAVIICSTLSSARNRESTVMFKRRIEPSCIRQANATACIYLFLSAMAVVSISMIDGTALRDCIFEVCSAIGTVGLSTGITPSLSTVSQAILMLLMYAGRLGAMSLMLVLAEKGTKISADRPYDKIMIG